MLVLPRFTAPAALKRSITCASYGPTKFESIFEPQVVRQPFVTKMSLCATGIPISGFASAFAIRSSGACGWARLFSDSVVMNALRGPFRLEVRSGEGFVG